MIFAFAMPAAPGPSSGRSSRDRDGTRGADAHDGEERDAGQGEPEEGDHHGDAGEDDGGSGGRGGPAGCFDGGVALGEEGAGAGDDEEA